MNNNQEVILKLQEIESVLQDQVNSTKELEDVVTELKSIVTDLDKKSAVDETNQSHLKYRIEVLEQELKALEQKGEKGTDKQRALVENALMVILGGVIAYLFSLPNN